jgi:predicted ATPase
VRDDLPTGTVTFLFSDVEGSTKLLHELGAEGYAQALADHRRVVREACTAEGGVEVDTQGDAFFFAFPSAPEAVAAAQSITEALGSGQIHLRIGLHTGTPLVTDEGYVGHDVHVAARVGASAHGGQVVLSSATRALVDGLPITDLGEHRLKDIEGAVSIYQVGENTFPPLKTISNTNLPRPASSFVGRERELEEVLASFERGARLLTLTGPGGSGKTRLAIEAATALVHSYKAGVFWIGLASLREASLVTETIAQTLGAKDGLAEYIADREMLLLLDNLEQVIDAAPALSRLVEACPNLTVFCTSRELLRVQGEVEYQVPPLASSDAVALFRERSGLEPSSEIAELCARLDDLPLAVELAAARTKALAPAQILDRLSDRLDLLKGGRDADDRQQTLRATIAWSCELLSEEEQRVFRALSVFAGGCILEAAEEVAAADLDTLQSLVEKSLLRFANRRYWMLETIKEYARERLDESPEADALRDHHAWYFRDRLEERRPYILGTRRAELLAWFGGEEANFRAALDRLEQIAPPDAARAADQLAWFWFPRGQWREGRERFAALLAHEQLPGEARAMLLYNLGEYESRMGDTSAAESHAQEAHRLAKEAGQQRTSGLALITLSRIAFDRGDHDEARRRAVQMLDEAGDDEWLRAQALDQIAELELEVGRLPEARTKLIEAKEAMRATGDMVNELEVTIQLATLELYVHDFEAARRLAISVLNKLSGDQYRTSRVLNALGFALVGLDRRGEARDVFAKSLDLVATSGMTGEGILSQTLAGTAYATEKASFDLAAQLLGAVHRLNDEAPLDPGARQRELEHFFAQTLRDALGAEKYAGERALGATMTHQQTIELARSLVERSAAAPPAEQASLA